MTAFGFLALTAWMSATGLLHAAHHATGEHAAVRAGHVGGDAFPTHGWHRHDGHEHAHPAADHDDIARESDHDAADVDWTGHPHYRTDVASRPRTGDDAPLVALAPQALPEPAAPALVSVTIEASPVEAPRDRLVSAPSGPRAPPAITL